MELGATLVVLAMSVLFVAATWKAGIGRPRLKLPPGPKGWPVLGNWFLFPGGKIVPKTLRSITEQYGDLCLIKVGWCNLLVVSSPDLAKEVLLTRGGEEFGSRSLNFMFRISSGNGQDMVFANYGEHWSRMKRLASLLLLRQPECIEEEIEYAIDDIAASVTSPSPQRLRSRLQLSIYNILYRMLFNRRFSSLEDQAYLKIEKANALSGILLGSFKFNSAEFFPILRPFFHSFVKQVRELIESRHSIFQEIFIKHYVDVTRPNSTSKAGIEFLLEAEAKQEINMKNLLFLIQNMNVGALGTTTAVSKWAVVELVNNPEEQQKIYEELERNGMGRGKKRIKEEDVKEGKLKYVEAFTKEVLRKHMAIPMLVPHLNQKTQKLGEYEVPAQSRIIVNVWGIANDPRFWEEPEKFKPSRFISLGGTSVIEPFGNDFRFLPFGSGRRSCPGGRLAYITLTLLVAKLVQSFHLLPPYGSRKIDVQDHTGQLANIMINKMPVVVNLRDESLIAT